MGSILTGRRGGAHLGEVHHAAPGALQGPATGLLRRAAQATERDITGGSIAHAIAGIDRQHSATVLGGLHGLHNILPDSEHFRTLAHKAQRAKITLWGKVTESFLET